MEQLINLINPTVVFSLANALYVVSYTLTNIIGLRVLAIVASLLTLPYFYLQEAPLWSAIFWQLAYFLVNYINLMILLYNRRPPKFDQIQSRIAATVFSGLRPHEVTPLLKIAKQARFRDGEHILNRGKKNTSLMLIVEGCCKAYKEDKLVAALSINDLVGEMSFISGEAASADVIADGDVSFYIWHKEDLEKLYAKQSLYKAYIHSLCGVDLARKLRLMTEHQYPATNATNMLDNTA